MQLPRFGYAARTLTIAAWTVLLLGVAPHEASGKRIKCWTNDDGVRECGDVVPPKYSQKGHRELSRQGVTVSEQKRARSKEEVELQRRAKRKQKAQREREARLAREQAAKDRVLLDTFTTEEDLVLAHQGRLAAIDIRVRHTRQIVNGLKADLSQLRKQAAGEERSGRTISDGLENKISGAKQQISEHLFFISERHSEKIELDRQFSKDLARYRRLKGTTK